MFTFGHLALNMRGGPWSPLTGVRCQLPGLILLRIGNLWPSLRKGGNGFKYPVVIHNTAVSSQQAMKCSEYRFVSSVSEESRHDLNGQNNKCLILFLRWIIISQDNDTLCITVYCSPGTSCVTLNQTGSWITNHWPITAADDPDFNLFIGPSLNSRHYTNTECSQHQLANGCHPPDDKTSR